VDVVLKADDLSGGYLLVQKGSSEKNEVYVDAVSDVSLQLERNEIFGIAGESGCGKSTLLKMIYGLLEPPLILRGGSVTFITVDGEIPITSLSENDLRRRVWWKKISYIPQSSMNVLNPTVRIRDHFIEMFTFHARMTKNEAYAEARKYIDQMGLPRDVLSAFPHQLSGGMRQRVVIALSLLLNPNIVLADEPTSALDVISQKVVLTMLEEAQKELKNTLVIVSHDLGIHGVMTHRMGIMYAGKIVEIGKTEEIFEDPLHPYSEALIRSLPKLGDKKQRTGLGGHPPDLKKPPSGCRFHPRCPYAMPICSRTPPKMKMIKPGRYVACWKNSMEE